ncbi:MAG: cytochrome C oxidase subunit IV family protein [Kordiimonadaceae bacterium]|nr:cytochrome C oxidase subunit IV family protein [Kordiimonadaceae bacterium]
MGAATEGQQHPIGLYLKIWTLLFILSALSYSVDFFQVQGLMRWSLIIIFMLLKAGLIVAVFMHMMWERFALMTLIILPPLVILVLVGFMVLEANYVHFLRLVFMSGAS